MVIQTNVASQRFRNDEQTATRKLGHSDLVSPSVVEMKPTPEEQLLQMSISGKLPDDLQKTFDAEKNKGNAAYRESRYEHAISHYNEAETINPMSPLPPANRAMIYLKLFRYENAKQEAAVALELQQALPPEERSHSLRVKILLRRATANKQLMLYALAAEDYQAVLDMEKNEVAAKELAILKEKYNFDTAPGRALRSQSRHPPNNGKKIEVVNAFENTNAVSSNGSRSTSEMRSVSLHTESGDDRKPHLDGIQDETELVQLPKSMMANLVSKWSSAPPNSSADFERVWRSLQDDNIAQAKYLLETVGPSRIKNGILGDSLTPQLLERFVAVLTTAVDQNRASSGAVADLLQALISVSRFEMLLMFLSSAEKGRILTLVRTLQEADVAKSQIETLMQAYG